MTQKEKSKKIILIGILFIGIILLLYLFFTHKKNNTHEVALPVKDIVSPKQNLITTEAIEATITKTNMTPPMTSPNDEVKVGDKVSYRDLMKKNRSLDDTRHFNTPLLITTLNGAMGFHNSAPKLSLPKNSSIKVYLESPLNSENVSVPIGAIAYTDLIIHSKMKIPKTSRFVGRATINSQNARMSLEFSSVTLPNGKEFSIRGVALGEDNIAGLQGTIDHRLSGKGAGMVATSLLDAASQSARFSGNGFSTLFAGEMAGNTSDLMDSTLDYEMKQLRRKISVPMNTRFKIIFLNH